MERRSLLAIGIAAGVLGLVLYGASIGPAYAYCRRHDASWSTFRAIYTPIFWVVDRSDAVDTAVARYEGFCYGENVVTQKEANSLIKQFREQASIWRNRHKPGGLFDRSRDANTVKKKVDEQEIAEDAEK